METRQIRDELLVLTAQKLSASHGVFFAAALLADFGVPLNTALVALTAAMAGRNPMVPFSFALSSWLGTGTFSVTVEDVVAIAYIMSNTISSSADMLAVQRDAGQDGREDGTVPGNWMPGCQ
ncbi:hypothetical protein H3H36_07455 [Duganella sp. FT3S]|uniref:Uncharacterized protein n=1 Tax=Rugamonas fusca TaxID=2758568 RepID=A0A7W2I690_9BURK|nr:hypothetical protein [Rugamonas fusca]MBA5605194.1 hypothetical protein [Rugamonas fusca]